MVRSSSYYSIIQRIVLVVTEGQMPAVTYWHKVFQRCSKVTLQTTSLVTTDAMLVSVMRCEPFGCRAGSTNDTLGRMFMYDRWFFERPLQELPRYLISNAVWRDDPPLQDAITQRLDILGETIAQFNATNHTSITSLGIDCATLGFWREHTFEEQELAISVLHNKIEQHFGCIPSTII